MFFLPLVLPVSLPQTPYALQAGQVEPPKQEQKSPARIEYDRLYEAGKGAFGNRDLAEAQRLWSGALKIAEREKWDDEIGRCLNRFGIVFRSLGLYDKALESYERSLKVRERAGKEALIAESHSNIGNLYYSQGHYEKALDHYERSLKLSEKSSDDQGSASTLMGIGNVYDALGQSSKALNQYERSLKLNEKMGNQAGIASNLTNIGLVYISFDRLEQALVYLQRSLQLHENTGNKLNIASSRMGIGKVYHSLGRFEQALDQFQRSLRLYENIGDEAGVAMSLNNIGTAYDALGQSGKALVYHLRAQKSFEMTGNEQLIAAGFSNLGIVYFSFYRYDMALDYELRALKIREKIGNEHNIAISLNNIGNEYRSLNKFEKALDYLQRSMKLNEKIGDHDGIASNLTNVGLAYYALGRQGKALDFLQRSLKLEERIGNELVVARQLDNIGKVHYALHQYEEAAVSWARALKLSERVVDQVGEPGEVGAFQDANQGSLYLRFAALRERRGRTQDALQLVERYKGQGLARQFALARTDLSKILSPEDTLALKEAVDKAIGASAEFRTSSARLASASGDDRKFLEEQTAEMKEILAKSERDLDLLKVSLYAKYPAFRRLTKPSPPSFAELANLSMVNPDTLFIEYGQAGREQLTVSLLGGKVFATIQKLDPKLLQEKVSKYLWAVGASETDEVRLARELYRMLLGYLERERLLGAGVKRICVVADGPLLELPFAALIDGKGRRLLERFAVSSSVSLGVLLWPENERKPTRDMLVVADPTGGGGEVRSETRGTFGPLPGARKEGIDIYDEARGRKKLYVAREAKEADIKAELGKYAVLHFACHGSVNSKQAMRSCLVLAPETSDPTNPEDGVLEAREIMGIPMSAQLAVLSACETAQGVQSGGEGLMGLAWAFRAAGVPSVVASKWQVDDAATSRIMVRFYQELRKGARKDDALRTAMLAEMKYPVASVKPRAGTTSRPPAFGKPTVRSNAYYWAAFQLIGEAGPLKFRRN